MVAPEHLREPVRNGEAPCADRRRAPLHDDDIAEQLDCGDQAWLAACGASSSDTTRTATGSG
jgi:hypothetical protein